MKYLYIAVRERKRIIALLANYRFWLTTQENQTDFQKSEINQINECLQILTPKKQQKEEQSIQQLSLSDILE